MRRPDGTSTCSTRTRLSADWAFERIVAYLDAITRAWLRSGPWLVYPDGRQQDSAWRFPTPLVSTVGLAHRSAGRRHAVARRARPRAGRLGHGRRARAAARGARAKSGCSTRSSSSTRRKSTCSAASTGAGWDVHYFPERERRAPRVAIQRRHPGTAHQRDVAQPPPLLAQHHSGAGARIAALATGAQYAVARCGCPDRAARSLPPERACVLHARDAWRVTGPGLRELADEWNGRVGTTPRASGAPILLLSLPLLGVARLFSRPTASGSGSASSRRRSCCSCPARSSHARCDCAARRRPWPGGSPRSRRRCVLVFVVHGSILARARRARRRRRSWRCRSHLRVVSGPPPWGHARDRLARPRVRHGALARRRRRHRRRALPPRPRAKARTTFGDLHVRSVSTSSQTAACTRDTPSRSGTRSLRSSRRSAESNPTQVMLHEPSAIVPIAFAVVYEAGLALFRSAWLGVGVLVATVSAARSRRATAAPTCCSPAGDPRPLRARGRGADALLPLPAASRVGPRPLTCRDRRRGAARPREHRRLSRHACSLGFAVVRVLLAPQRLRATRHRARRRSSCRPEPRSSGSAARPGDGLALAVAGRARARADEVRDRAARRLAPSLRTSSRGDLARRRSRRRGLASSPSLRSPRGSAGRPSSSAGRSLCSASSCFLWVFPHFADAVSVSQARRARRFRSACLSRSRAERPCWPP